MASTNRVRDFIWLLEIEYRLEGFFYRRGRRRELLYRRGRRGLLFLPQRTQRAQRTAHAPAGRGKVRDRTIRNEPESFWNSRSGRYEKHPERLPQKQSRLVALSTV